MHIKDLAGKNICILGFGREGQAMLAALNRYVDDFEVTIADSNEATKAQDECWMQTGTGWLENLHKFDCIIKSPGIPPNPAFKKVASKMTTATQIFLDTALQSGALVIGVTGSKGKSTTSSLIYAILKAADKDVHLVGNIGIPSISHIHQAKPGTIFVLEMSSYQLMDLTTSPQIAVVTSFFPEHLDYHGSLKNYLEAKKHIARFQDKAGIVFHNDQFKETKAIAQESQGKKIPYGEADAPVALQDILLIGRHNLTNIAGAWKVCEYLSIDKKTAIKAIRKFKGLPHRLQSIGKHHGIEWIDDSISTTPESAIAALRALDGKVGSIILGGQDRGYDFGLLIKELLISKSLKHVVLFPGSGKRIETLLKKALKKHSDTINIHPIKTIESAVIIAKKVTPKGTACLLSPASPSYGFFKNFEERGEKFQAAIS